MGRKSTKKKTQKHRLSHLHLIMCLNTNICTSNENITSISCNAYNVYKIRRIFPQPNPIPDLETTVSLVTTSIGLQPICMQRRK